MELIPYRKAKKVGYCLPDKTMIIEPQFERATPFVGEFAWVKWAEKWGVLRKDGSFLIRPKYDYIDGEHFDFWKKTFLGVRIGKKWGIVEDLKELISPLYDVMPCRWFDGTIMVTQRKKVAFVNDEQELIVPFAPENPDLHKEYIINNIEWRIQNRQLRNSKTNEIIELPTIFDKISHFITKKNLFCCYKIQCEDWHHGIMDTKGVVLLEPKYYFIDALYTNPSYYIFSENDDLKGLLSDNFQLLLPPIFYDIQFYKNDIFYCHSDDFMGFRNAKNEIYPLKDLPLTAIQVSSNTANHEAFQYHYWVDMLQNIVYAEDLPSGEELPIINIASFLEKKYAIEAFKLPYFEDFDLSTLGYYDAVIQEKDLRLTLDSRNIKKTTIDTETLNLMRSALENIPAIDALVLNYIQKDFERKGYAADYIDHFLEYAAPDNLAKLLQKSTQKGTKSKQLAQQLRLSAFRVMLHSQERFIWLDYTINPIGQQFTNYVLTIFFNQKGELMGYTMES